MPSTDTRTDDAPPATSKRSDAVDAATDGLTESNGDHVAGRAVTINKPASELFA